MAYYCFYFARRVEKCHLYYLVLPVERLNCLSVTRTRPCVCSGRKYRSAPNRITTPTTPLAHSRCSARPAFILSLCLFSIYFSLPGVLLTAFLSFHSIICSFFFFSFTHVTLSVLQPSLSKSAHSRRHMTNDTNSFMKMLRHSVKA